MPERRRLERELADLGLRERENDSQAPVREVVIGEMIVLDLDKNGSAYAGVDLINIHWRIPGTVVATYWDDRRGSDLKKLAPADLQQRRIAFHWLDAQDGQVVWGSAHRMIGGIPYFASWSYRFDVKAPTVDQFDAVTTSPRIVKGGILKLRFGAHKNGKNVAGVQWDWKATMPANHGGSIKDLQTLRQGRERLERENGKIRKMVFKHPSKGPHDQLDQDVTDDGSEATYSSKGRFKPAEFPMLLKAGQSFHNNTTWDSPATTLESHFLSMSVDQRFKYYVLYKPDKPGAIWVPLAKAEWFWKAKAERRRGAWVLTEKDGKVTKKENPTTEHPLYQSNAGENKWIESAQ